MHKESELGEANAGQAQLAEKDGETIQPMELVKRLFEQMAAFPWVACGAIGTGFGVALLYFYFRSIDFIPADIPSLFGASLFVAMLAFALFVWVVASLIAPLWAYREADFDDPNGDGGVSGLWALQLLSAGAFLLFIGYRLWRDCKSSEEYVLIPGAILTLCGAVGWAVHEMKRTSHKHPLWKRQLRALGVCFFGVLPFIAFVSFLLPSKGSEWLHVGVFFGVWLLVVVGSSTFLHNIPLWGCALLVMVGAPIFMISITGLQGHSSALPTQIAQVAGIRSKNPDELRVPKSTCDLIQNALGSAQAVNPLICGEGAWGTAHAQVLSNLGDRWFIELSLAGAAAQGSNGVLRLSIPGDGVQKVRRIAAPPASCRS